MTTRWPWATHAMVAVVGPALSWAPRSMPEEPSVSPDTTLKEVSTIGM